MAILSGIPVLNCQSIETTLNFYQRVLQFVVIKKRDSNGSVNWVHLMHGGVTIMLQSLQSPSEKPSPQPSRISLYFFSDDVKELHHFVKLNYKNVSDLTLTNYQMHEFSLIDPEGNTVIVGQATHK